MASRTDGGIPGIAVGLALTGAFLMFAGIKNVGLVDGLREFIREGTVPAGKPPAQKYEAPPELAYVGRAGSGLSSEAGSAVLGAGSGPLGKRIAETARKYLGVPYVWGGASPRGWDCSGLVTYVLNEAGVKVPRMTSGQFLVWRGAYNVARSHCAAGDLVCWVGHIGIAINNSDMVNAPTFGVPTRIQKIRDPMAIRRVKEPLSGGVVSRQTPT